MSHLQDITILPEEPESHTIERYLFARMGNEVIVDEPAPHKVMIQVQHTDPDAPKIGLPHGPDEKELPVDVILDADPKIFEFPKNEKYHQHF